MRVKLVRDACDLCDMSYWTKKELEEFNEIISINQEDILENNTLVNASISLPESLNSTTGLNVSDEEDDKKPETMKHIKDKLMEPIRFYETNLDAQCFTTRYEDGLCMVFRGTTNIHDWLINMDSIQTTLHLPDETKDSDIKVHRGFKRQYQSLELTLFKQVNQYMADTTVKESNRTFYYFGHSLGGALATLSATIIGSLYPNVRHVCITFGSPRVGNDSFVKAFKKHCDESVRAVN